MRSLPRLVLCGVVFAALPLSADEAPAFKAEDAEADGIPVKKLMLGGKEVARFMVPKFDPELSKPKGNELKNPTFKPYLHLFDFAEGKLALTNGPEGQYPHHRGLYYGFNKTGVGGKTIDTWHCNKGGFQQVTDPGKFVLGTGTAQLTQQIDWCGPDKAAFAKEERSYAFAKTPAGLRIDFGSTLTPVADPVKLDGDPQHAGFHVRLNSNEVEKKTAKETYFVRPDGKGKPNEQRNWEPKNPGGMVNLPWDAISSVIGGTRYTFLIIDHPDNPKESRHSERTYGRMGSYFEATATKEKPLKVKYRVWVVEGELSPEKCKAWADEFVAGK
jgi:hypothetical protein